MATAEQRRANIQRALKRVRQARGGTTGGTTGSATVKGFTSSSSGGTKIIVDPSGMSAIVPETLNVKGASSITIDRPRGLITVERQVQQRQQVQQAPAIPTSNLKSTRQKVTKVRNMDIMNPAKRKILQERLRLSGSRAGLELIKVGKKGTKAASKLKEIRQFQKDVRAIKELEKGAAIRSKQSADIFRAIPGLKGTGSSGTDRETGGDFAKSTARALLALPARATIGLGEHLLISGFKLSANLKGLKLNPSATKKESLRAVKQVPITIVKGFDPRSPEGLANIIATVIAFKVSGKPSTRQVRAGIKTTSSRIKIVSKGKPGSFKAFTQQVNKNLKFAAKQKGFINKIKTATSSIKKSTTRQLKVTSRKISTKISRKTGKPLPKSELVKLGKEISSMRKSISDLERITQGKKVHPALRKQLNELIVKEKKLTNTLLKQKISIDKRIAQGKSIPKSVIKDSLKLADKQANFLKRIVNRETKAIKQSTKGTTLAKKTARRKARRLKVKARRKARLEAGKKGRKEIRRPHQTRNRKAKVLKLVKDVKDLRKKKGQMTFDDVKRGLRLQKEADKLKLGLLKEDMAANRNIISTLKNMNKKIGKKGHVRLLPPKFKKVAGKIHKGITETQGTTIKKGIRLAIGSWNKLGRSVTNGQSIVRPIIISLIALDAAVDKAVRQTPRKKISTKPKVSPISKIDPGNVVKDSEIPIAAEKPITKTEGTSAVASAIASLPALAQITIIQRVLRQSGQTALARKVGAVPKGRQGLMAGAQKARRIFFGWLKSKQFRYTPDLVSIIFQKRIRKKSTILKLIRRGRLFTGTERRPLISKKALLQLFKKKVR